MTKVETIKIDTAEIKLEENSESTYDALSTASQHVLAIFYSITSQMMQREGTLGPTRTFFLDGKGQPMGQLDNDDGLETEDYVEKLRRMAEVLEPKAYITIAEMWGLVYDDEDDPRIGKERPSEVPERRIEGVVYYIESFKGESVVATCQIERESEDSGTLTPLRVVLGGEGEQGRSLKTKFSGVLQPKAATVDGPSTLQ